MLLPEHCLEERRTRQCTCSLADILCSLADGWQRRRSPLAFGLLGIPRLRGPDGRLAVVGGARDARRLRSTLAAGPRHWWRHVGSMGVRHEAARRPTRRQGSRAQNVHTSCPGAGGRCGRRPEEAEVPATPGVIQWSVAVLHRPSAATFSGLLYTSSGSRVRLVIATATRKRSRSYSAALAAGLASGGYI
jgi:hypothetical protein